MSCKCLTCGTSEEEENFIQITDDVVECDVCNDWFKQENGKLRRLTIDEIAYLVVSKYIEEKGMPETHDEEQAMERACERVIYRKADSERKVQTAMNNSMKQILKNQKKESQKKFKMF